MKTATESRRLLLEIYAAALARVEGRRLVREYLALHPIQSPRIVAFGKAAAAMTLGALDALGDGVDAALVITKHGHGDAQLQGRATVLEAGHPQPDAASLAAGAALQRFIVEAAPEQPFLFLISGGASALAEVLPEGITLAELEQVNRYLLGSGLPIAGVNQIRKRLSLIKQGRLARQLHGRPTQVLIISDVPGDDPAVICSGPLAADPMAEAPLPALPEWLSRLTALSPPPPAADDPCFSRIETHLLATNRTARLAAAERGCAAGLPVMAHEELLQGDVREAAGRIADMLATGGAALHIWGGETTVRLPAEPGRGGRCQQLALMVAERIAGRSDLFVLAAGTDGSDGPGEDAGALVDGGTIERGGAEAFDVAHALACADAGSFLEASGDLVATGPTGTNVMDLIIALKNDAKTTNE